MFDDANAHPFCVIPNIIRIEHSHDTQQINLPRSKRTRATWRSPSLMVQKRNTSYSKTWVSHASLSLISFLLSLLRSRLVVVAEGPVSEASFIVGR